MTNITNDFILRVLHTLASFTNIVFVNGQYKVDGQSPFAGLAEWEISLMTDRKRLSVAKDVIRNGGFIQTIKAIRQMESNTLREAKELAEAIRDLPDTPTVPGERFGLIHGAERCGEGWNVTVSVGADRFTVFSEETPNLESEVRVVVYF